jgi:acetyltransferase
MLPAIRPYPTSQVRTCTTRIGQTVTIRPIRPEDEPMMVEFHQTLRPDSIYLRYFHPVSVSQLSSHDQLARLCFTDYDRELNLVAELNEDDSGPKIIGLGQLSKINGTNDAEFSILVSDAYQTKGLGTELLAQLVAFGRKEQLSRIVAEILPQNEGMRRVAAKLGFKLTTIPGERIVYAELVL